ncbi:MAG: hypothetical protein IKZ05_06975, partial [Clostridia bacterium]|nr:hypothetical protein [Clostridia bacterium]
MKRRIKKTLSFALAIIMLLSMVPLVYAAEDADEFAGLETLEEIPFEFVLEPGDLPYELLREAVLDVRDIPACIDPALAEERGHVNRLYLQEPDDCTVMFQNRDGSKTIYLFSHPVKGMTASTVATVQINGTSVSFSGENAVTSRLAEITNFNIGSAEIAYLPVGVLSENGVNITEDVRDWALAESIDVVQAYNISSEAAAEYAASVAVPETDAAATAAAAPGITITPNDPAPLGGMTVMSISYSDLAGAMRFKNVSTNEYLTFSNSSLTVSTSFQLKYSEWVVQYDSFFGYVVSNLSDPYNTYIGYDDTETFMIDTLSYMMYAIEPVIVSTSASTVRLQCSLSAIDANAQMYELSPDESDYPDSCTWQIMNKRNIRLVTSISVPTTIVEQSGVSFIYSNRYSFPQPYPTYYEIELYDATSHQPFDFDTKIYEDDEYWCAINTPGIYTAYYKDNVTGVRSKCFALVIVDSMPAS